MIQTQAKYLPIFNLK